MATKMTNKNALTYVLETYGDALRAGAGTVMSREEVLAAKQAGAEFILAPNVDRQVTASPTKAACAVRPRSWPSASRTRSRKM